MRKIGSRGLRLLTLVIVLVVFGRDAHAIPTTRVQDTLFNADGSTAQGSVTIEWKGFTASDGSTITTNSLKIRIVQGVLLTDLVPNENSTPAGTAYTVTYLLNNGTRFVENWVVPESATPVTVSDIRIGQPPPLGSVIAISQVTGLNSSLNNKAELDQVNVFTAEQIIRKSSATSTDPLLTFQDETATNSVSFRIPTLGASTVYTLPASDGLPSQQLTTDGSANLFWSAAGTGAGTGTSYEIFQDSGAAVTQRIVANFTNGLTAFDNVGQLRTEVEPVYGAAAGTITEGNDSRLSDARTPLVHASTHASGGGDVMTPGSIGALKNSNDSIISTSAGAPVLIVRGITGQAASIQEWRDGTGDLLAHITPQGSGFFREMGLATKLGGTVVSQFFQVDGLNRFAFSGFETALNISRYDDSGNFKDTGFQILRNGGTFVNTTLQVSDTTPTTGATKLTVKAGQGQGTTKLQEWRNNAGTVLSSVDESGNIEVNSRYVEFAETTAPPPGVANEVRLYVDSVTGELTVKKDSGSVVSLEQGGAGGSFGVFQDAETPSGTIDGVNVTFTLAAAPNPAASLVLTKNGIVQESGSDFTLSVATITFLAGAEPQAGDTLLSWYRTDGSNAGGDLTGTFPNPVVSGIRGRVVSTNAPLDGQCLVWSNGSSQWMPLECAKVNDSLQWHFAGAPSTGTQPMVLTIPEGVNGVQLINSRIVVNTTGGASTFNIERCTSNCSGTSPTFSPIYATDRTLALGSRTVTGGTPTSSTANAGDQFRVSFGSIGSGVSDVTVSLTYQHTAAHL